MEVPLKWRPRMKLLIKGITSVWGAFLIGFVISLFLLPCTSGPYIVILGLLSETATRSSAILWLLLYNFIFILPMLAITIIISQGIVSSEKIEMWRQKNLKVFHLIAGLILILLGIFMFLSMKLGWI
jgi:cytochrome c biogenesis protein CcdA